MRQLQRITLIPFLTLIGLASISVGVSAAEAKTTDGAARCHFDPTIGGPIASPVKLGLGFGLTTGAPVFADDGWTYMAVEQFETGGPRGPGLSIVRFDDDGDVDRRYGQDGHVALPTGSAFESMSIDDGAAIVLVSGSYGDELVHLVAFTSSGAVDEEFGRNGVISLEWAANQHSVSGLVGEDASEVFIYDHPSRTLHHRRIDHSGAITIVATTEMDLSHIGVSAGVVDGAIHLSAFGDELLTPSMLGSRVSVTEPSSPILGRDGDRFWTWHAGIHEGVEGHWLVSTDLQGITSEPVRLPGELPFSNHGQDYVEIEAALTTPAGEILLLAIQRGTPYNPIGWIYRFANRSSLVSGEYSEVAIDLGKGEAYPPPTELLLDTAGGVRVFSGAWATSSPDVSQARLLDYSVTIPQHGATSDQIRRLYLATFDRLPEREGTQYWVTSLTSGASIDSIATFFAASPEFQRAYGDQSDEGFVQILYRNVLGREGDPAGETFWIDEIESGRRSRANVLLAFSDSAEFVTKTGTAPPGQLRWAQVAWLYQTALGREPDVDGFCGMVARIQSLPAGTEPALWVADQIVNSHEFGARFDGSDEGFLRLVLEGSSGEQPSPELLDDLLIVLETQGRAELLRTLSTNYPAGSAGG